MLPLACRLLNMASNYFIGAVSSPGAWLSRARREFDGFDGDRRRFVITSTRIKPIRPARFVFKFTYFLPEGN